jgi:hypothetical protein
LTDEQSQAISQHLKSCSACRSETNRLAESWVWLGSLRTFLRDTPYALSAKK